MAADGRLCLYIGHFLVIFGDFFGFRMIQKLICTVFDGQSNELYCSSHQLTQTLIAAETLAIRRFYTFLPLNI